MSKKIGARDGKLAFFLLWGVSMLLLTFRFWIPGFYHSVEGSHAVKLVLAAEAATVIGFLALGGVKRDYLGTFHSFLCRHRLDTPQGSVLSLSWQYFTNQDPDCADFLRQQNTEALILFAFALLPFNFLRCARSVFRRLHINNLWCAGMFLLLCALAVSCLLYRNCKPFPLITEGDVKDVFSPYTEE